MRFVYLEAGSGMEGRVSERLIASVRQVYEGILIVGGGIKTPEDAAAAARAGADIIVIGTMLETDGFEDTLRDICKLVSP
jgi:phosphoglycerol geranylgeranyltransferase